MKKKELIYEFFKYAVVGASGIFVNLFFLYTLTEFFNVYYIASEVFAFTLATFSNFSINKVWTFKENIRHKFVLKGGKFFVVAGFSLLVNIFFLYAFTEVFQIYYITSQILASGFTLITNYTGNKFWTFRKS